jgi:hypothetical protein
VVAVFEPPKKEAVGAEPAVAPTEEAEPGVVRLKGIVARRRRDRGEKGRTRKREETQEIV